MLPIIHHTGILQRRHIQTSVWKLLYLDNETNNTDVLLNMFCDVKAFSHEQYCSLELFNQRLVLQDRSVTTHSMGAAQFNSVLLVHSG